MSSYLERQQNSFTGALASAAAKLGPASAKKPLAPPSPSPSVTSTTSVAAGGTPVKKDRDVGPTTVFSQPALTGTGHSALAQMTYVINWLKEKDEPKTIQEILEYVSLHNRSQADQENFIDHVRRNPHIKWIPDENLSQQTWHSGTYVHRPTIPNVKNKTQLLAYMQRLTDMQGVLVKDLMDGWPNCHGAIDELEKEHKLLVLRFKKDEKPKQIWSDDPSLFHAVNPEFKAMWHKVELPHLDSIHQRLIQVGQKPTSEDPMVKILAAGKVEKKKKRANRRGGKTTNSHMQDLLKDYSHMRR
ncbi:transcription initiation factor IIE, beta subunit [Coniochaeta ligniaria NRRL 30616]|uniref:Transcription initiation factor IIE subunit beta n=1 Tax=Coniochaeta ligniaria NRRL 30616 TaxID=1408157 RepID=A0A1J7IC80_9PEZI|nr:transcription initiation factor IIE, beta subunit [Coniochaeta ligniaria NRRL 30616]